MPFSALTAFPLVLFAVEVGDIQAGLLSVLIIIGLAMTLRAQIQSSWRERAEAAEKARDEQHALFQDAKLRVTQLEALPNIEKLYNLMQEHDKHSSEAWQRVADTLGEVSAESVKQTEALTQLVDRG